VVLSKALVDLDQVRELVNLWDRSSPYTAIDRRVVLSVDAVAFHRKVMIASDREVVGLDDLDKIESPDLFEQFLLHPQKFAAFLRDHWSKAYSLLLPFQIQPLRPGLPCCHSCLATANRESQSGHCPTLIGAALHSDQELARTPDESVGGTSRFESITGTGE
jgi:hypothetical protein